MAETTDINKVKHCEETRDTEEQQESKRMSK